MLNNDSSWWNTMYEPTEKAKILEIEKLPEKVAKSVKKHNRTVDYNDLVSWGRIGLYKASQAYDKTKGNFEPFAKRCIANAMYDNLRVAYRHPTVSTDTYFVDNGEECSNDIPDYSPAHIDVLLLKEKQEVVREAVNRLPEQMRNIVSLYGLEGYTGSEVANILDVSEGYVYSAYSKALDRLLEDQILRSYVLG